VSLDNVYGTRLSGDNDHPQALEVAAGMLKNEPMK
jgi:hypothetical protein